MNKFNRNTENKTKEKAYKHKDDNTTASAEKLVHEGNQKKTRKE